ncbi:MAG TPA: three-Cys-motif partner protein TcmP [Roseiflexaceae bacterium]|nr:three-Cys-motif partner protein TcmP [Roseiflexaceae bacterium]
MKDFEHYKGREQTWVKHYVLRQYLQKLVYKIGRQGGVLNYVDGFAGPWQDRSDDLSDTSPHIAIHELLEAQNGLAKQNCPPLHLRCLFNEDDRRAAQRLAASLNRYDGASIKTQVLCGTFEENLPTIHRFVQQPRAFSFFFIDPTGWSGFGMRTIEPVLQLRRSEVLINFMTEHIRRFIDDDTPQTRASFDELFGIDNYRAQWQDLKGQDREDAIVQAYCRRIQEVGQFSWVSSAVVLHPTDQRSYFHLIYATRHDEGLRVFREVERKAMAEQEQVRAKAQQDRRINRNGQFELFEPEEYGDGNYYGELRNRFLVQARQQIEGVLQVRRRIVFEEIELLALANQLVWPSDLKKWIKEWQDKNLLVIEGLGPKERVPKKQHILVWNGLT